MDTLAALRRLGLEPKQTLVYLKALELGASSMTELARAAGLKRPSVYLAVEELLLLGLLSEVTRGKRKVYSAVHPRRLLDIVLLRAHEIEEALPELVALHHMPKERPKIQVFEGKEGVKMLYRELYQSLNNKKEALWFSNIGALKERLPEVLTEYKRMLRALRHPKIRELNFGDEAGKAWVEELRRLRGKNHFLRTLPTEFPFGLCDNLIFDNRLVIFSLRGSAFVTVIESADVAQTYRTLFEWAWKQGKEA